MSRGKRLRRSSISPLALGNRSLYTWFLSSASDGDSTSSRVGLLQWGKAFGADVGGKIWFP